MIVTFFWRMAAISRGVLKLPESNPLPVPQAVVDQLRTGVPLARVHEALNRPQASHR